MQIKCPMAFAFVFLWSAADISDAAELEKEIARCATIEGDLERLECFDYITGRSGLDKPQPQSITATGTGKWKLSRDKNPVDDSERVVIRLSADTGRSRNGGAITFVARCQSNKTDAYIIWNDYLGDDSSSVYQEWKYVTVRIGDNKAQRQ
jgi:Type VI secretion system VasI, EvfG, VC_A0118